jgi:class 3 adenylate cyclase
MDVQRRSVTILFADLVGFTAFTERWGEEAAYVLMEAVRRLMSGAVEAHGGTVKEVTGDGIIALFGVPLALEDAPLRACRAALSIQRHLADGADAFASASGTKPQLRISINTGAVVVGPAEEGFAVFGDSVNTAARLQAFAPPGAILLSKAMHKLVSGLVDCEFVGLFRLKGKSGLQPAYRLDGIRQAVPRFQAALARGLSSHVGRARELKRLERILLGSRRGLRVADIAGEAGIGKSRLIHEFLGRSARLGSFLSGSCSPEGRAVPFYPFIDIIRAWFGIAAGDEMGVAARKLSHGLAKLELHSPQNVALLQCFLAMPVPPAPPRAADGLSAMDMRNLLHHLLEARCRLSPLILLLEDLQWIDAVSEDLLTGIIRAGEAWPLAILHTRRPEYRPPWLDRASTTSLRLGLLSAAEARRIAGERLGSEAPRLLLRLVAERAGGNPLFAEELADSVLEHHILIRRAGLIEYNASAAATVLPTRLKLLLTARLDSLAPNDRALLRVAAVIGRRFTVDVLAAVAGEDRNLRRRLAALRELGLVRRGDSAHEFVFTHALMRDTLYDSLLGVDRAALHVRIAAAIERRSADRTVDMLELVAHHWRTRHDGGARSTAFTEGKSAALHSVAEAERHFARALEVAAAFPLASTLPQSMPTGPLGAALPPEAGGEATADRAAAPPGSGRPAPNPRSSAPARTRARRRSSAR